MGKYYNQFELYSFNEYRKKLRDKFKQKMKNQKKRRNRMTQDKSKKSKTI